MENIPFKNTKEHWKRSMYLPFLAAAIKPYFRQKKDHIMNLKAPSSKLLLSMMKIKYIISSNIKQ